MKKGLRSDPVPTDEGDYFAFAVDPIRTWEGSRSICAIEICHDFLLPSPHERHYINSLNALVVSCFKITTSEGAHIGNHIELS